MKLRTGCLLFFLLLLVFSMMIWCSEQVGRLF